MPGSLTVAPPRLLVVGLGNPLCGDDGVGPAVIAELGTSPLPAGVRAVDGGTDALRLPSLWCGEPEVWWVDAVAPGDAAHAPGSVLEVAHEALLAAPQRHDGAHALSLPEALRTLALAFPELAAVRHRLFGVVAGPVAPLTPLGPAAARAVVTLASTLRARMG